MVVGAVHHLTAQRQAQEHMLLAYALLSCQEPAPLFWLSLLPPQRRPNLYDGCIMMALFSVSWSLYDKPAICSVAMLGACVCGCAQVLKGEVKEVTEAKKK